MPRKGANLFQGQLDPEDHRQALALMEKSGETKTKLLKKLVNQEYEKQFTDGGEMKEVLKIKGLINSLTGDIDTIKTQITELNKSLKGILELYQEHFSNKQKGIL
jgi:hypothetical protein